MKKCKSCGVVSEDFSPDKRARDGLQSRCRPCCRAAKASSRRKNIELAREKARSYYAKNRDRILANNARSREKNRDKVLASKRAYYERVKRTPSFAIKDAIAREMNKDRKRAYDARYHEENRAKIIARVREWAKNNRDRRNLIVRQYAARRRSQKSLGVSGRILADWARQQPKVCFYCGADCHDDFHIDHFLPLARGGAHVLTNLRIACGHCNRRKNARDPAEWIEMVYAQA